MVINWWNIIRLDFNKIWDGKFIPLQAGAEMGKKAPCCWHWWTDVGALKQCEIAFNETEAHKHELGYR